MADRLRTAFENDPKSAVASLSQMFGGASSPTTPASSGGLFTLFSRLTEAAEVVTQSGELSRLQLEAAGANDHRVRAVNEAAELRGIVSGTTQALGHESGKLSTAEASKFVHTRLRQLQSIANGVRANREQGPVEAIAAFVQIAGCVNRDQAVKAGKYDDLCDQLSEFGDAELTVVEKIDAMENAVKALQQEKEAADRKAAETREMHDDFARAVELALEINTPVGLGQIVSLIQQRERDTGFFRESVCRALDLDDKKSDAFIVEALKRATSVDPEAGA